MAFPQLASSADTDIEQQQTEWSGKFAALDVVRFTHRRFDGRMSLPRTWELFRRGNAAALLPYDPWTDQVVVIEQFRLPALAAGVPPVMVEIPAGLFGHGEDAEQAARREAGEEIGLTPDRLVRAADVVLSAGGSDERCVIFAGRVRAPPAGPDGVAGQAGLASEHEDIRIRVEPAARAIERAIAAEYPNSVTTLALLWLAARRAALRAEWQA